MDIEHILGASSATEDFKRDVRALAATGHAPRIVVPNRSPRIKVLRVIAQLLSTEPALEVDAIRVLGDSGCADFTGIVDVEANGTILAFEFAWDCQWRAREEGWNDCFGFPDQIRAAQEFEWRCFRVWHALDRGAAGSARESEAAPSGSLSSVS